MTRFLLVSRSAEYETRLRRLLRPKMQAVPGEYLTFGANEVVNRVQGSPRIAILGPLLSFEETSALTLTLMEEHPGIGLIVVREQRSDLEDWVDGIEIHAVLSPEAPDATTEALLDRLDAWLVSSGRLPEAAVDEELSGDTDASLNALELIDLGVEERREDREAGESGDDVDAARDEEPEAESPTEWVLPPIGESIRTEIIVVAAPKGGQGKTTTAVNLGANCGASASTLS